MLSDERERRSLWGRRDLLRILGTGAAVGAQPEITRGVEQPQGIEQPHDQGLPAASQRVDVAIVGAGFSGLSAARALVKAGKKVVVLEARNRVGGRVKAGQVAGRTVDVGGMWVGATQTRLLELIKEFDLHLVPQFEAGKKHHRSQSQKLPGIRDVLRLGRKN